MSALTTTVTAVAATLVAAYGIGQFTTKSLYSEIEINAPASAVWAELTDQQAHETWNPLIRKLQGNLTVGERLNVSVQIKEDSPMEFQPTVLVAEADAELRWVGQLGFRGIFDGEHYFIMEDTGNGTTLFRHGENFSGMLTYVFLPLIAKDTLKGFEAMNVALKARVEENT